MSTVIPSSLFRGLEVEGPVELGVEGNFIGSSAISIGAVRTWEKLTTGVNVYVPEQQIRTSYLFPPGTGSGMTVNVTQVNSLGRVTGLTLNYDGVGYRDGDILVISQGPFANDTTFVLGIEDLDTSANNKGVPYPTISVGKQTSDATIQGVANYPQGAFLNVIGNTIVQPTNNLLNDKVSVAMGGNMYVEGTINGLAKGAPYLPVLPESVQTPPAEVLELIQGPYSQLNRLSLQLTPNTIGLGEFMFSNVFSGAPSPVGPPTLNILDTDNANMLFLRPLAWQWGTVFQIPGENALFLPDSASTNFPGSPALNLQLAVERGLGPVSEAGLTRQSNTSLAYGDWVSIDIKVLTFNTASNPAAILILKDSCNDYLTNFVLGSQSGYQPEYSPPPAVPLVPPPQSILIEGEAGVSSSWMSSFRISLRCGNGSSATIADGGPQYSIIKLCNSKIR